MPLIATVIRPHGLTRMFFDCRDTDPDPRDQQRIERAIEAAAALGRTDEPPGLDPGPAATPEELAATSN
jgi:hypothetical protein